MTTSVPVFYRPSALSMSCPHLMKPISRFVAMYWLDQNALQIAARAQRQAYLQQETPRDPPVKAMLPAYLSDGETPPWRTAGKIRQFLPRVVELVVKRQHDVNELTAIIHLSNMINQEFRKRKIVKSAPSGELWVGYVQGVKAWAKNYMTSCLVAERWFISAVMENHAAASQIATVLADAVENPGKPADYYLIAKEQRPPELVQPEASAPNKKPK